MIADFEDFVTWLFVTIDDLWQQIAPLYARPGPDPTSCSDSELLTIMIASACRGWDRETHLHTEWKPYRHLFPKLPERSRLNRRRRNLMYAMNHIRQIVLAGLDVAQDAYGAIDGLPLPVMKFHLAPQRTRDWDAHGATFGYCGRPILAIACIWWSPSAELLSILFSHRQMLMNVMPQKMYSLCILVERILAIKGM